MICLSKYLNTAALETFHAYLFVNLGHNKQYLVAEAQQVCTELGLPRQNLVHMAMAA